MTFRTKPSVEAGIIHSNSNVGFPPKICEVVVYEPGNGTRYEVVVSRLPSGSNRILGCDPEVPNFVCSWLNDVGKCMIVAGDGYLDHSYVMEKMHISSVADAMVLTELFGYLLGIQYSSMSEKERTCTCHSYYDCGNNVPICANCGHVETEEEREERKREFGVLLSINNEN
jgi:hypothetical protein